LIVRRFEVEELFCEDSGLKAAADPRHKAEDDAISTVSADFRSARLSTRLGCD